MPRDADLRHAHDVMMRDPLVQARYGSAARLEDFLTDTPDETREVHMKPETREALLKVHPNVSAAVNLVIAAHTKDPELRARSIAMANIAEKGDGPPVKGPLPGLGGSPVSFPTERVTPASAMVARTRLGKGGLTDALIAADALRSDPEVMKSKGQLAVGGKHNINITPETEAALARVNPDPETAIALSLAASDHAKGHPHGHGLRAIGLEDQIDIAELTRQNGGRPPRFLVTHRDEVRQADWRANEEAFLSALGPVVARDDEAMRGKPLPPRGSRPRLPSFDEKSLHLSLPTLLAQAEPELTPLIRRAKMFKFDKESEKLVASLMATDWREWLGQALIPFPTTFIESGIQWHQWQAEDDPEPIMAVGSRGVLIHGRVVVPCFRVSEVAATLTTRAMMIPAPLLDEPADKVYTPEETALISACAPDFPDLLKVWGVDYVQQYGPIDGATFPGGEIMVAGHVTSARRLMRVSDRWSDFGMLGMVMSDSILRWALAALAVINSQRDVIEIEARASNHDGRTWVGNKHVPKYSPSLIRLKPEAPRVEYVEPVTGERPEPDPDREIIKKRAHDVRAHFITKDYKPNDDWEAFTARDGSTRYRRIRKAHKRGDETLGVVDSAYALGDAERPTPVMTERPTRGETELSDAMSTDMGATNEPVILHDAGGETEAGDQTLPPDSQESPRVHAAKRRRFRLRDFDVGGFVSRLFGRKG